MLIVNDKLLKLKKEKINSIKKDEITIFSENKKENLTLNIDKLIYITIDGNYASFFIKKTKGIKELILRNTLSNILKQIENYPFIFRCHKSYIINSLFFDEITGNARGYFLKSKNIENKIPVSRSLNKTELEKLLKI
ncbi:LytTR family DNA-binding domain-containing protein [Polaribacter sp. KT25b]|uniref:LytTR family DNA-binding domain-containing protein n=1 Tax=Polaribacter sp. KT25b TaxID=1855336 RepID=UPI0012FE1B34|nr:LytTR family DNA-binding domain-containing protein [Polaribacter sp. KT25b]